MAISQYVTAPAHTSTIGKTSNCFSPPPAHPVLRSVFAGAARVGYGQPMSTLAEIEDAIEKLPNEQLFQLTDWISERFSDAWDRQIEQDIVAGKLDDLAAEAIAEHRAGQSLPLPADEE